MSNRPTRPTLRALKGLDALYGELIEGGDNG
jgi:hypothetical protein